MRIDLVATKRSPFSYFKTSPEIIRPAVMLYVRFPLSLRNVEDLLHERGIEISHETVRFWWNRFGPMSAEVRCSPLFSPQPFQSGTHLYSRDNFKLNRTAALAEWRQLLSA